MKIGFLTPEYPHPKTGGAGGIGASILHLANGLAQHNHQVSILIYGQDEDEVFVENKITLYRIKNRKVKGLSLLLSSNKISTLINSLYKKKRIEILEAPDWTGITALLKTKCPIVLRLHGSDTYFCHLDNRPVKFKNKFLEKKAFKKADAIISVSAFTGQLTNTLFKTNKNIVVIPNSISVKKFTPSLDIVDKNTILYFGTLIRKKGALDLPLIFNEVVKKVPNAQLILAGSDSGDIKTGSNSTWNLMKPLFTSQAMARTNYIGKIPYNEIQEKIQAASICVFPTYAEALPVSWIEAMAMEKPIVASNIGWAKEVITQGVDGLLEAPDNHKAYASKIITLLKNDTLRTTLGKNARQTVLTKFTNDIIAKQSVDFYKTIIDGTASI